MLEWVATLAVVVGAALTAFDGYPLSIAVCLAGSIPWLMVGLQWRRPSIVVIQATVILVYPMGSYGYPAM
jgi:hypothetical protein